MCDLKLTSMEKYNGQHFAPKRTTVISMSTQPKSFFSGREIPTFCARLGASDTRSTDAMIYRHSAGLQAGIDRKTSPELLSSYPVHLGRYIL